MKRGIKVGDSVLVDDGSETRRKRYAVVLIDGEFVHLEDKSGVSNLCPSIRYRETNTTARK